MPPKKVPRGTPSSSSAPSKCFWRGWSRRGRWKFILQMLAGVHHLGSTQLTVEGFFFQVSRFLNTGIEWQHQYLSYKLLTTSVTLFVHILWRDSHSWLLSPRICFIQTKSYYIICQKIFNTAKDTEVERRYGRWSTPLISYSF